jgi:hypothetical protein
MELSGKSDPSPRVAFEYIRETCRPSHIDATIRVEIGINTFKIEPNENLEEFIRRFNELHARLKTPFCDEVKIRPWVPIRN